MQRKHRYWQRRTATLRPASAWTIAATSVLAATGSTIGSAIAAPSSRAELESSAAAGPELEEVTVTARKRNESLLEIPLSITAFTAKRLEQAAIGSLEDLASHTPSLFFTYQSNVRNDRSAQSALIIRGINPRTSLSTRQTAQLFLDGAPIAGGGVRDFEDIERIEVIRGPQSAYFGRATFSGAVNVITRDPSVDGWRGRFTGDLGRFDRREFGASLEGPLLAERLAIRVGVQSDRSGGQYRNAADPSQELGARRTDSVSLSATSRLGERLRAKAFVQYYEDHDGPQANGLLTSRQYNCAAGASGATLNWFCGRLPQLPDAAYGANVGVDQAFRTNFIDNAIGASSLFPPIVSGAGLERHALQATLRIDYEFAGGLTLQWLSALADSKMQTITDLDLTDSVAVPNPNFGRIPGVRSFVNWLGFVSQTDSSSSHELRLGSADSGRFRWTFGLNSSRQESANTPPFEGPFGGDRQLSYTVRDPRTEAAFGAVYFDMGERFTLSTEARYQRDRIRDELRNSPVVLEKTFDSFTPRIILDFKPGANRTYYASWARGIRPGAFNANLTAFSPTIQAEITRLSGASLAVDQEQLDSFEIGAKLAALEGRLSFSGAAYYGNWTNQHVGSNVPIVNPATGRPTLVSVVSAIGRTRLAGIELEASLRATERWSFQAGAAINDTNIREFVCSQCQSTITGSANVSGKQLAGTPRTNGSFAATYRRPLSGERAAFARVDYLYRDTLQAIEANLGDTGSQRLVNLRAGLEDPRLRLEAYVTNLFENDTYRAVSYTPNLANLSFGNAIAVAPPEKRSYGIRVRFDF